MPEARNEVKTTMKPKQKVVSNKEDIKKKPLNIKKKKVSTNQKQKVAAILRMKNKLKTP
jgi:hypothetical protein